MLVGIFSLTACSCRSIHRLLYHSRRISDPFEEAIFPWQIITPKDMQPVMELSSNINGQGSVRDLVMSCASSLLRYQSRDMTQDHIWDPPDAFRHLSSLRIPLDRRGEPSLLLHDLGEDPHAKRIELYRYVLGGPTSW